MRKQKFKSWNLSQRTHHNSLSPICNAFPSELLAEVFAYLSISEKPGERHIIESHMLSATREILGWIKVTHVCRHWRNVALDYPSLWGHISYNIGPEWTRLMMERVKAAPIILKQRWRTKYTVCLGAEDYIPSRIGQIEELDLYGHPVDLRKIFDGVQAKAAPKLRTLCIHSVHREHSPASLTLQIQDSLFLGGEAPLLREISLTNCRLSWTSPLLNHLTSMDIRQEKSVHTFLSSSMYSSDVFRRTGDRLYLLLVSMNSLMYSNVSLNSRASPSNIQSPLFPPCLGFRGAL